MLGLSILLQHIYETHRFCFERIGIFRAYAPEFQDLGQGIIIVALPVMQASVICSEGQTAMFGGKIVPAIERVAVENPNFFENELLEASRSGRSPPPRRLPRCLNYIAPYSAGYPGTVKYRRCLCPEGLSGCLFLEGGGFAWAGSGVEASDVEKSWH